MIFDEKKTEALISIFSKDYDFHFCSIPEIEDVVNFIDQYWKKNHILVLSRELLDWQYLEKKYNRYNFVIARERSSGEIHGLLGFIQNSHFDDAITCDFRAGAIWKVRNDIDASGLGIVLDFYTNKALKVNYSYGIGLSSDAIKNWKVTTVMEHYFLKNPNLINFKIAKNIENCIVPHFGLCDGWQLKELNLADYLSLNEDLELFKSIHNFKSKKFYINRYYKHPVYKYLFLAIQNRDEVKAIFILRECYANDAKCIRIIDYIGKFNFLKNISENLLNFLTINHYEYMDILAANIDFGAFQEAGFINRRNDEHIVIPNYFEPFLRENVAISYTSSIPWNLPFFKGDADQDRPNVPWW